MSSLYTPPTWDHVGQIEGALLYSIPTCYAVFRIAGVWQTMKTPGMSDPDVYSIDIDPVAGRLFITTPTVVPANIATELAAFNPTLPPGDHPATLQPV